MSKYEFLAPSTITAQGKVVIKYQDTQGNKLAEDAVLVGNVGDVYETQRKDIASYVQYGNDPINKIGNFDSNDTEVIYVYERENNGVNVLNQDNVITVQVVKGQNNKYDEIGFSIVTKSTTGDIIKGAKYMVTDKNSSVIKNSTSYGDKLIIGKLTISEEGTDSYSIKQLSAPSGYNGISDTIKLDVNKKLNTQTNKYEVTISAQDYKNVEISMENGEIIVVVLNEKNSKPVDPVNPKEPEDPEEPEKPEEPVKEKKFDLQIEKYIKEVKIITDDEVITKTKDRNDKEIMKIDIPKNKIEKTKLQKNAIVINKDYKKCLIDLSNQKVAFDIIYIDPPYKDDIAVNSVEMILSLKLLRDEGFIIVETDELEREMTNLKKLDIQIYDCRKYGRANLIFLK